MSIRQTGMNTSLLINCLPPPPIIMEDLCKDIDERKKEIEERRQRALERMTAMCEEANHKRNKGRYSIQVNEGDYIMIRRRGQERFSPRFLGCYRVAKVVGNTIWYGEEGNEQQINVADVHVIPKARLEPVEEDDPEVMGSEDGYDTEGDYEQQLEQVTEEIERHTDTPLEPPPEPPPSRIEDTQEVLGSLHQEQGRGGQMRLRIPELEPPVPRNPIRLIDVSEIPRRRRGARRQRG
eukprot:Blabericola_migrator_1__6190@NODE_3123_length_2021_cov_14_324974_g1273_i2_p1_GENE_NODE_3123_length_2021_cov_14_324974_g1273_i2NODE_3123_length_2021_cov_14_324974_g1273_i2_p1_ORF_typecomplete_len237_score37_20DUF349/PF03993_12/0_23_NODE_3123_length_2021_cov_14_324974_g1273_i210581768